MDADEPTPDLRDHRGRLRRLLIASTIGAALTAIGLYAILAIAVEPNSDPVAGASVMMLGIAMFVVATSVTLLVLGRLPKN
jgi:uncharacterized membrane protein YidH (DUF202 family)